MSGRDGADVGRSARIVLRPIATPLPVGFLALAGGTFVLAGLQLGWVEPAEDDMVAAILIGFAAPLHVARLWRGDARARRGRGDGQAGGGGGPRRDVPALLAHRRP
jgi:hypothetical protein